jgi:hypothetical protein
MVSPVGSPARMAGVVETDGSPVDWRGDFGPQRKRPDLAECQYRIPLDAY